ncbi:unnamed protein product [Paramecium primaurelia]|uniref:Methylisocitrate lyase n=1 Tax=Paramecium primaurelia TaxID=5886 RepID=A0A8S1QD30_PARPR|nr:unnamed protein product [Paramecium primaurelia]
MLFKQNCSLFRKLLSQKCLMMPGAYNGMVGRQCADNGFEALYISGAAVTASSGVPDIGMVTLDGFCKTIKDVALASGLPILADADTGFGEGEMCSKTVWEYFIHGASGLHIEDQVFPKRCGHLDGKELVPSDVMEKKIQIAKNASVQCSGGEFVICARTDARGTHGLDECIKRSKAYMDAGADMIFPEGLHTKEEMAIVAKELKSKNPNIYLLANMTEFGKTPYISLKEFESMGYNCVIYPVSTLRIASKAIDEFLKQLQKDESQVNSVQNMQTRKELYSTLGYTPGKEWYFPNSKKQ